MIITGYYSNIIMSLIYEVQKNLLDILHFFNTMTYLMHKLNI